MAFALRQQNLIVGNSKAGTTLALTVTTTSPAVGDLITVHVATDNTATTDTDGTEVSVTDSGGNTYTRVIEKTNGQGAAKGGAEAAIFYCVVGTALTAGSSTITITNANSGYARAAVGHLFSRDTSKTITVESTNVAVADGAASLNVALSGLTSREYLWLGTSASESSTAQVGSTNFTSGEGTSTTSGGGSAANMGVAGASHISTATGITYDADLTGTATADWCSVIAALYEASSNKTIDVDSAAYTYTATAAGVELGRVVVADSASYTYTATDAGLSRGIPIVADSAAYAYTATDAALEHDKVIDAEAASYTWTATDAALQKDIPIVADSASYAWTAQDAALDYVPAAGIIGGGLQHIGEGMGDTGEGARVPQTLHTIEQGVAA